MIFSLLGILILSPVMLTVAILIKVTSPGPVLYRSRRVGRQGKHFTLLKFRSMVVNADQMGVLNVGHTDPRVTGIGRYLRITKLDELPQLFNVLSGDMAIVGPRPELPRYVEMYSQADREKILALRPGITDWASIVHSRQYVDFSASDDPDRTYLERIWPLKRKLQLHYSNTSSTLVDLRIMFWTIRALLLRSKRLPRDVQNVLDD